jgi:hypothetical protein
VLRGIARSDSAANPANPDPSVAVRYGEQRFEDRMVGFFEWAPDRLRRPAGDRLAGFSPPR